ncbi:PQ-loop repeat-containing protein 1 [Wickerhamomyces ciferrii]|uniref:PQ-loop repeat-containing protein 1 n=1 Tax=Wickerhamomyces ciferrii (strain ATCC 14091 / BCRC 22168 / CBS 111 / JCM 3599 / NBRC 0793 / NRRL Y-1031 F-60-10) TaxID=1206466 RepID=K0K7W6_WICCF|nr:PQ-loop repeat-containing protein 1 [Wickerhamomyces ciferrii]CCH40910.1 PQ-loop repeat-containing protein 1 [Wickerhamomyces ciferrii]
MENIKVPTIDQFYLPEWLTMELIASNIISFTPLFSYGTTILSIQKKKTSLGFSIDICATMLIAASLRICYYFIIPYEQALLRQSIVMIFIQLLLLRTSLKFRPREYDFDLLEQYDGNLKMDLVREYHEWDKKQGKFGMELLVLVQGILKSVLNRFINFFDSKYQRIGSFWQWNNELMYWKFLFRFTLTMSFLTWVFNDYLKFGEFLGTIGLFVESLLPLPQILLLKKLKHVQGFKLLLLVSWLGGDFTKIGYLIFGAKNISGIFLFFALFQMSLDFYIGYQYVYYKYYYIPEPQSVELYELRV